MEIAAKAIKNMPYEEEEVEQMLLDTAIELGLQHGGKRYDQYTDISTLLKGFLSRCKQSGLLFVRKGGEGAEQAALVQRAT